MENRVQPYESYIDQSPTTDPGDYADLLAGLPSDLAGIAQVTQGLFYHYMSDQRNYGWAPPQERLAEINTRTLQKILAALLAKDQRPLTTPRAYEDRLVGCCRDFSLLACAILRYQGRAARLRYGFGSYFYPIYWGDHVIVETWYEDRWLRFDPQLALRRDWGHNLLDLDEHAYVTGGRAWQVCRGGADAADHYGLGPNEKEVRGWWFIRERLQLDVAALNKVELLCWDNIEELNENVPADVAILDEMAALSCEPDSTALRQRCATDPRWQIPSTVSCFHPMIGPAFPVAVA